MPGCPIRKSTDRVAFADPRGLSQLITSFIASESLGIPRVPLFTFFTLPPLLPSGRLLFGPLHCCMEPLLSSLVNLFSSNMSKNSLFRCEYRDVGYEI